MHVLLLGTKAINGTVHIAYDNGYIHVTDMLYVYRVEITYMSQ